MLAMNAVLICSRLALAPPACFWCFPTGFSEQQFWLRGIQGWPYSWRGRCCVALGYGGSHRSPGTPGARDYRPRRSSQEVHLQRHRWCHHGDSGRSFRGSCRRDGVIDRDEVARQRGDRVGVAQEGHLRYSVDVLPICCNIAYIDRRHWFFRLNCFLDRLVLNEPYSAAEFSPPQSVLVPHPHFCGLGFF